MFRGTIKGSDKLQQALWFQSWPDRPKIKSVKFRSKKHQLELNPLFVDADPTFFDIRLDRKGEDTLYVETANNSPSYGEKRLKPMYKTASWHNMLYAQTSVPVHFVIDFDSDSSARTRRRI